MTGWTRRDSLEGFYSQQQSQTRFTSVLASWDYGCNQLDPKGKHQDIPLDYHFSLLNLGVHCFIVFLIFFAQNQLFLSFDNWTNLFFVCFVVTVWSQIHPCFNVCMDFDWLWFLYIALFLQMTRWRDFFFFSLMFIIFHVLNPFCCCAGWEKIHCFRRRSIWRKTVC